MADKKKKIINSLNDSELADSIKKTKKKNTSKNSGEKRNNQELLNEKKNVQTAQVDTNLDSKQLKMNFFSLKEVIGIVIITAIVGFFMGMAINKNNSVDELSHYEKELLSNYQYILDNYYKEIDARDLVSVAIKGMISNLDDPYADYINLNQINDFNIIVNGSYAGIGIQITYNETGEPIIVTVFENSPAANGGLKKDDILLTVDGVSVSGKTLEEIQGLISDLNDSTFEITYKRNEEDITAVALS